MPKALYNSMFILFILFMTSFVHADTIDISKEQKISLLEQSQVCFLNKNTTYKEIVEKKLLKQYDKHYINTGMLDKTIWISFTLSNSSDHTVKKALILTSSLLEHIALYKDNAPEARLKGVSHIDEEHDTLFPFYTIVLAPQQTQKYYLEVKSKLTPVDFSLKLMDEKTFFTEDRLQQFINIFLIGFVCALALYSFLLFFYTRDKSYLYYSFYLFALIYQQFTYLGLTQIYFPLRFIAMDMHIPVLKVNILIITAALFAMHFLNTKKYKKLHTVYQVFITLTVLEILFLSTASFYNLYIIIFTGALFIIFNLAAGIYAYRHGHIQARLFIVGFGIVFISYILIIFDAIGLTSIMQHFQNLLMVGTAFEALILSLAFADRYILLQKEKAKVDSRILEESRNRTTLVKKEVEVKTKALNAALEGKELLLKEVHHRVKNNLQIILSIIRLQNDEITDEKIAEKFRNLENRINAISQTYNMLLIKDELEEINMKEYIDTLLDDLQKTYEKKQGHIDVQTHVNATVPLRESVYIGLIINELVTNIYKHAFDKKTGSISIGLTQDKSSFILSVEDNGKGFSEEKKKQTLGLKLVQTLVYNQLGGEMHIHYKNPTKYTIRFTL